ncbi:MAG: SDR family NAD(P)-dependent oxidoreductase [Planctomycetota bacterium]|nr:SDR family NAD(P)-dependent oxidoreductase [Planctomycetota bacterium]
MTRGMTQQNNSPLAIVGMACCLPGAPSLPDYWKLLVEGKCALGKVPESRFDRELYFDPHKNQTAKTYIDTAGTINYPALDPTRCNYPTRLMQYADVGHLMMCQVAADACRHAGLDPFDLPQRNAGVYIGNNSSGLLATEIAYAALAAEVLDWLKKVPAFCELTGAQAEEVIRQTVHRIRGKRPRFSEDGTLNVAFHVCANAVSESLGLSGPSLVLDAACSSSLKALAMAARDLWLGVTDMAVVGGASYFTSDGLLIFSASQAGSSSGVSCPFSDQADGLVSAEGYAAVIVKTLDRALADGDPIQCIVRGIGISSDGKGKSLWAPRAEGQVKAVQRAYGHGAEMSRIVYLEAHATSTSLGDQCELDAMSVAFAEPRNRSAKAPIGGVKANIGHVLEPSGLAGLIKTALVLQNKIVPQQINCLPLNSKVDWEASPFYVPVQNEALADSADGRPRQGAVNAFGVGGLNAHVVVEEWSGNVPATKSSSPNKSQIAATHDPIAIIGIGCLYPGARTWQAFADLVFSGQDPKGEVPTERWNADLNFDHDGGPWQSPAKRGGFITDYEYDWRKHRIAPKALKTANPLQFMVLDCCDAALANAGYGDRPFDNETTGVIVGSRFESDFSSQLCVGFRLPDMQRELTSLLRELGYTDNNKLQQIVGDFSKQVLEKMPALLDETGSFTPSSLCSRLTKTYNLMGGAGTIDSGNTVSLAAIAQAIGALRTGACNMMLCAMGSRAMGLTTYLRMAYEHDLAKVESLSTLDRRNQGQLPGEGAGVLVLKRLSDAQRDGDPIRGIIHGVGTGFSSDPREAFSLAIERAWRQMDVSKDRLQLVELSAAPSCVVDQEIAAINANYGQAQVVVGTAAAQFGNSLGASGMTSLLRANAQLDRKSLPSQFGLQEPRDSLTANDGAHSVTKSRKFRDVPDSQQPLAGVSSWDNCGSAYHLILERGVPSTPVEKLAEQSPEAKKTTESNGTNCKIVRLEAATLDSLVKQAAECSPHELFNNELSFQGSETHRLAIVTRDVDDLGEKLKLFVKLAKSGPADLLARKLIFQSRAKPVPGKIAFLFAGQGSQYAGMLSSLIGDYGPAQQIVSELDQVLTDLGYPNWNDLAYENGDQLGVDVFRTQLSLLVADTILSRLLASIGVNPHVVAGHSFGEFAALHACGAWTFRDAAQATKARCDAIVSCQNVDGGMLSTNANAAVATAICQCSGVPAYPANLNAEDQTVIGSTLDGLPVIKSLLEADGYVARMLPVNRPFHTPLMAEVKEPLREGLKSIATGSPKLPILSSVTNEYVDTARQAIENLVEQMIRPVAYRDLITRLLNDGVTAFIECGPAGVLTGLHKKHERSNTIIAIASDDRKGDGLSQLLAVRASLEVAGYLDTTTTNTKSTDAAQPDTMPESTVNAMFNWGRQQREEIRRLLRRHIDSNGTGKLQKLSIPGNQLTELKQVAAGADVWWPALADYCCSNMSEQGPSSTAWQIAITTGLAESTSPRPSITNGAISHVALQKEMHKSDARRFATISPSEFRKSCGVDTQPSSSEVQFGAASHRFLPRVMESPLGHVDLAGLRFNGRVLIVGENETSAELASLIKSHGGEPLFLSEKVDPELAVAELDRLWDEAPLPHLYILTACDSDAVTDLSERGWNDRQSRGMMLPFRVTSHWFKRLTDSKLVEKGSIHAATILGGDFGFSGQSCGIEGGAIAGLVKSLIHEASVPTEFAFQTTLVDFSGEQTPAERARLLLTEVVARQPYELEVGYAGTTRFLVRPVPIKAQPGDNSPAPSGAWIVTGGGRGITALVAKELAKRFGVRLHLLGSSPAPEVPAQWRGKDEATLKLEIMQQAKAAGLSPAAAWRSASRMLELDASLESMRSMGVQATYHLCDVSDRSALAAALESIRKMDGPITGVLHGAGIEVSSRLQSKDPETVRRTLDIKTKAAAALADLTANDPLRHFIGFGSITGRVGCPGQADYAMANEAMAKLMAWLQLKRPECRVTCFDWGPWNEIGMAARPETKGNAVMSKLTGIPPDEGVAHFLAELSAAERSVETLVVGWDVYRIFYTDRTPEAQLPLAQLPLASTELQPVASAPPIGDGVIRRYVMRWESKENQVPVGAVSCGRALVVGDNRDAVALAGLLRRQGTSVAHYKLLENDHDNTEAESIIQRNWRDEPITHVYLCSARDADASGVDNEQVWQRRQNIGLISPYRLLSAWLKKATAAGTLGQSVVVGLTSLGGDCGFVSGPDALEGSGLAGVLKSVHAEHGGPDRDNLRVKVIDAPADEPAQRLAEFAVAEAIGQCGEVEVCCVQGERRLPRLLHQETASLPKNPPQRGATWVVTGGARGITAEVVRGLGRKYGLKLHLLGTRPLPQIDESIRYLSDEELKPHKRSIIQKAIRDGVKPENAWGPVRRDFEIDRNLRSMAAEGIHVTYHECDVMDKARMAEVLDAVRKQDGPISGLIHGAGIQGIPTNVRDMLESSVESARKTLAIKVRAMLDLIELTQNDPLEYCIGFGSISGRFGSNSASFYCAGTDMLCKIMDRLRRQRPGCRAVGFHWHGWSDVGMIMRPEGLGTAKIFKLELLSPADGVNYLINELEVGVPEGEVVITNPKYIHLYHPKDIIAETGIATAAIDSSIKPMVARTSPSSDWPEGIVGEIVLDPQIDPFLKDHRFQGNPLLPAVIALESFIEVSESFDSDQRVVAIHDLQLHSGLRLNTSSIQTALVHAEPSDGFVRCRLVADFLNRKGELVDPNRLHASAVCELSSSAQTLDNLFTPCAGDWHNVWYPEPSNLMYHGPTFQCLKRCAFDTEGGAWGEITASDPGSVAGKRPAAGWRIHPAVLDAALYLCGIAVWVSNPKAVALPKSMDCLRLGRFPRPGEKCLVAVRTRESDDREWVFDFVCFGEDQEPLFSAEGYRCQNVMKPVAK